MITFFTDESVADRGGAEEYKVSIYGGLLLSEETLSELTTFFYKLKDRYVLPQEAEIKWRFNSYWNNLKSIGHVDRSFTKQSKPEAYKSFQDDHTRLKNEILEKVASSDAKIIVAIRPNHLLRASTEQIVEYSIAALARKFERVLTQQDEYGIMLADELPKRIRDDSLIDYQYILDLCCLGSGNTSFERVLSIVPTINSHVSPIHQINDVVLGALQYYILEFIRKIQDPSRNMDMAKDILGKVAGSFLKANGTDYIINNGVLLYPPKTTRKSTRAGVFLDKLETQLKNDFDIT